MIANKHHGRKAREYHRKLPQRINLLDLQRREINRIFWKSVWKDVLNDLTINP